MKLELQQIRIAEACGFDKSHWLELKGNIVFGTSGILPDYPNDLNAMHEAEKTLSKNDRQKYLDILADAPRDDMYQTWADSVFTTAAQRAEAFLKTLNLWEK
jgi:hypothetical protein